MEPIAEVAVCSLLMWMSSVGHPGQMIARCWATIVSTALEIGDQKSLFIYPVHLSAKAKLILACFSPGLWVAPVLKHQGHIISEILGLSIHLMVIWLKESSLRLIKDQWGRGRHKLLGVRQATRMYCTTQGIWPIFCNNCKGSVTFKNCIKKKEEKSLSCPFQARV